MGQGQGEGQDGDGKQPTERTGERLKVACGGQPSRSFWIRAKQYTPGPITCGVCGQDFQHQDAVIHMRPSVPGPAQVGVTTHERLRLWAMTFRTDAIIDRVEAGRLLHWRAHDRQKHLQGSRRVEPTGPTSSHFTEVVEGGLLGLLRPLGPLVAWLLQRQATADLQRLKHLLETQPFTMSAPEEPAT